MSDPLAQVFGRAAVDYERGRPDWPAEALDLVTHKRGLEASAEVVDLAAGTGKLTRILAERFARVVAIEPDDEMRALISGAEALSGTAEDIPLPDDSADAVFCGEAFHWFDGVVALEEIARVLPDEERRELAAYLRSELAPGYRMRVTTDVYWTRLI